MDNRVPSTLPVTEMLVFTAASHPIDDIPFASDLTISDNVGGVPECSGRKHPRVTE